MHPTQTRLPAQRRTIDRRIVGTPEHVRKIVQLATASGRLVHVSPWQETPEGVQVIVRLIEREEPAAAPAPRRRSRLLVATGVGAGLAVLGVGAYALIQLVNAVIALLPAIAGGLLLLGLVALVKSGGRSRTFSGTFTGRMH